MPRKAFRIAILLVGLTPGLAQRAPAWADPAVGATHATYDLPEVTLRVEDGWGLDVPQVIGTPIQFGLDLQGLPTNLELGYTLRLRVYADLLEGASTDPSPVQQHRLRCPGGQEIDFAGAVHTWTTVSLEVRGGSTAPGVNLFSIYPDTAETGAWSLTLNWAEAEIGFNYGQIEAQAFSDIDIRRGRSPDLIGDTIWRATFGPDGQRLDATIDDPIADAFVESGAFSYAYRLGSWPDNPEVPPFEVSWSWSILDTDVDSGGWNAGGTGAGHFVVSVPPAVGKYELLVTFRFERDGNVVKEETNTHTLYAILAQPPWLTDHIATRTDRPKTAWLDVATAWAAGETTEAGALTALNESIYENPGGWGYGVNCAGGADSDSVDLIEGTGFCGICGHFREALRLVAVSLGIPTTKQEFRPYPDGSDPYLTLARPALDGTSQNATNAVTGVADRYYFSNHELALNASKTRWYDPTFGLEGPWDVAGDKSQAAANLLGKARGPDSPEERAYTVPGIATSVLYARAPQPYDHLYRPAAPRLVKQAVIHGLIVHLDSCIGDDCQSEDYDRTFAALGHVEESLDADLWASDTMLDPTSGYRVFDLERLAIEGLRGVEEPAHVLGRIIDLLVLADGSLAQFAVEQALGSTVYPGELERALASMVQAGEDVRAGRQDEALDRYRDAWTSSQAAMGLIPRDGAYGPPGVDPQATLRKVLHRVRKAFVQKPRGKGKGKTKGRTKGKAWKACANERYEWLRRLKRLHHRPCHGWDMLEVLPEVWDALTFALEHGMLKEDTGRDLQEDLAACARQAAVDAIVEALCSWADPDRIAAAQDALLQGDQGFVEGDLECAFQAYLDALGHAEDAVD